MTPKEFLILTKQCFQGESLLRALHNIYLNDKSFKGKGIDYGAKNASNSYYQFLRIDKNNLTFTDLYSKNTKLVKSIDFEKDFDLSDESFDYALMMNLLEHIYNHKNLLVNANKSLRNGGVIEGFVPFLHFYHTDPDDYFRYTHTALERLLNEAGFNQVSIIRIGVGGFTVSAHILSRFLKLKPLILISWMLALSLDSLLSKISRTNRDVYVGLAFNAYK